MQKIWTIAPVIAAALIATPAAAQATRTWVSGVGDDANPCSRTAPCKTFAGAISKTAAAGEINVLDPGGFGAVTITKSITIRADGDLGGVLVSGTNAITVNNASAKVILDGLDIEGLGTGLNGVNILSAAEVTITDSSINGFTIAGVNVNVSSGKTFVTLDNVRISGSNVGVLTQSASGRSSVRVSNSVTTGNADTAMRVTGAGNRLTITNVRMFDPANGLSILSGGAATSYGNNTIATPTTDAPTVVPQG